MGKNTVQALKHLSADAVTQNGHKSDTTTSICYANNQRSMIKSRWSLWFGSHMKTDNANRLTDPENLYMPGFKVFNWK